VPVYVDSKLHDYVGMSSGTGAELQSAGGAIGRAAAYLLAEAERQFAEVRHEMYFPHAAGFSGVSERQSGDIFARATLANLFLDIASLVASAELAAAFRAVARSEASYVARSKVQGRAGGWSYFPGLPELPPDADSLGAAVSLFARVAPEYRALCREALELVLASARPDGSFETWIVAPGDSPGDRACMQRGIESYWGTGADPDVLAHFYYALCLYDPGRYADAIQRGCSKLLEMQQPGGDWKATWYAGSAYGIGLVLRLLRKAEVGEDAQQRARGFLLGTQRRDGMWGSGTSNALETALSISALHEIDRSSNLNELGRGNAALAQCQRDDGSWPATPWIKMEIGRATGKILQVLTYESVTLTTAFCVRALLAR